MVRPVKPVGPGGKPLKSQLHHWWPRGLSQLWADGDGKVTRLAWDGSELKAPPKTFGAITNAHHMNVGAPWSASIEPMFGDADSALPGLVKKLETLTFKKGRDRLVFDKRLTPHQIETEDRRLLGECLASLLVRCPAYRNLLHITAERFWGRTGDQVQKHNDTLIAANIHAHYKNVVTSLGRGGKIAVLRSPDREFIMGEGYLSTLAGPGPETQYRCLIPLTPSTAVLAFAISSYWTNPPICTVGLAPNEVDYINGITQIYTRDYIFYRTQTPQLVDAFKAREFLTLQYHQSPWLDALVHGVASYSPKV